VDDGSPGKRRSPELDIDIEAVTEAVERDFKANRNRYLGHHTSRSSNPDQRIFEVEIATPTGKLFEGEVSFNAAFSVGITVATSSAVTVDAHVIRPNRLTKMRNILWAVHDKARRLIKRILGRL